LPRGAFLTTGSQKWVYVVDGTVAKKTAVTFGTLTANTVEVKSGLKAGDTVITSGYQDFIDQDQIQLTTTEGDKK
jgi:HlyD family secretion protein